MNSRLHARSDARLKDERLLHMLDDLGSRMERLETLNGSLVHSIESVRADTLKNADQKFAAVKEALDQFRSELIKIKVTPTDYGPFFKEKLGENCWNWIEPATQRTFITAEDAYRYYSGKAGPANADFTPALLEFCRGLESDLNSKLGTLRTEIQHVVQRSSDCTNIALRAVSQKALELALKETHALSMSQMATFLRVGRAIQGAVQKVFSTPVASLLAASPGPADIEQIAVLMYIATELRNGKVHSTESTSLPEIRLLRKLVIGIDEEHVSHNLILRWLQKRSWSGQEGKEIREKLMQTWTEYPGVLPLVWQVFRRSI